MIKIFLLCKNDLYLRTIEPILNENNISISGICKEPKEAVNQLTNNKADVIVMDANWGAYGFSGVDILNGFKKMDNSVKVILVTNSYEDKMAARAKELGAMGYFYRNVNSLKHITDCITSVYKGKDCFLKLPRELKSL